MGHPRAGPLIASVRKTQPPLNKHLEPGLSRSQGRPSPHWLPRAHKTNPQSPGPQAPRRCFQSRFLHLLRHPLCSACLWASVILPQKAWNVIFRVGIPLSFWSLLCKALWSSTQPFEPLKPLLHSGSQQPATARSFSKAYVNSPLLQKVLLDHLQPGPLASSGFPWPLRSSRTLP